MEIQNLCYMIKMFCYFGVQIKIYIEYIYKVLIARWSIILFYFAFLLLLLLFLSHFSQKIDPA